MRVRQGFMVVLLLAGGLAATVDNARAETISDANLFTTGVTATSSSQYNDSLAAANAVDGTVNTFVFKGSGDTGGTDNDFLLQIRGFDSAINTLRFYSSEQFDTRASPSVTIYYSSALNTADPLKTANYTLLGISPLATVGTDRYATSSTDGYYYSDATSLNIPTGTQSVLLKFIAANASNYGPGLREVQAFIPEPSSFILLVCGLIGLLAYAWRKRK